MSDFNWDSFANGDFVKFTNVGDSVAGDLLAVGLGTDFGGAACPKLTIRTPEGEDKIVTAGQKVLQSRLAEVRPAVGEKVAIVYVANGEAKPGQSPAKLFTVQVRGADGQLRQAPAADEQATVAAPAAPPAPPAPAPAAAAPSASSLV